jgi:acid stress-induced BolA-like protein IbaG/YrbA
MPIDPKIVQNLIEKSLPGAQVAVQDLAGDGDHLQAVVISTLFEGKGLLEQHQMVYAPLKEALKEQLHALALKTYSPQQWEKFGKNKN